MRAVVTGGAGFIGSNVVDVLIDGGCRVLALDDLSRGTTDNLNNALSRGGEFEKVDIRNSERLATAFERYRPDCVFHMAAQVDVRTSMLDPAYDAGVNILGSVNVFDAASRAGVRRVINTSTGGAIYGETDSIPTAEATTPEPISAYGLSKYAVERYADWFRRTRGLDIVTLRYGNVYGPRQDPRGDAGVIAIFCEKILHGARPTIYGDGRQTRDFVYVGDIAAANVAAAEALHLRHNEYNIGTGIEISVTALAAAVAEVVNGPGCIVDPFYKPARSGELLRSCLDVSRATAELQLAPPTSLPQGLAATAEWIRAMWPLSADHH